MYNSKLDHRVWLGLIFIIIGGIWLLDNLNILDINIPRYLFSWTTIIIAIGLFVIFVKRKPEQGFVLIAIGVIFLLRDLGLVDIRNIWHIILPAVFIIIGLSLIIRSSKGSPSIGAIDKNDTDYIDDFAMFGGRERTMTTQNFKGGKISAMFGGSDIDLRNADLTPGTQVLDIFAMFGGTSIKVPPDWTIQVEVVSILGGFSDNRSSALKVVPNEQKKLIIRGFVMFGGGEIKVNK